MAWSALNQGDAAILFCVVFFYLLFAGSGPWSLDAVREVVPTCDLAVVPAGDGDVYRTKSSNRVVLFMAAGLPVVAGDLVLFGAGIPRPGGTTQLVAYGLSGAR